MSSRHTHPPDQTQIWNGPAGRAWVEAQNVLDDMFSEIAGYLAQQAVQLGARRVLDVGCGAGATTLQIAQETGECLGVDISAPLIEQARQRAARSDVAAEFVLDDAQTHGFEQARFDLVTSRFGVMFFKDPAAALANLLGATRPGGAMRLVVWRSARENGFLTAAERAAEHMLPELNRRQDGAVGPFAFADPDAVRPLLAHAGWRNITFEPVDFPACFAASALELYMTRLGAVGLVYQELEPALQTALLDCLRQAYAPYVIEDRICFTARCWVISAEAPESARS